MAALLVKPIEVFVAEDFTPGQRLAPLREMLRFAPPSRIREPNRAKAIFCEASATFCTSVAVSCRLYSRMFPALSDASQETCLRVRMICERFAEEELQVFEKRRVVVGRILRATRRDARQNTCFPFAGVQAHDCPVRGQIHLAKHNLAPKRYV